MFIDTFCKNVFYSHLLIAFILHDKGTIIMHICTIIY